MAEFGLFVGWSGPVRGREPKSAEVFGEAVAYWTRLQDEGAIESWEAVFLDAHGGDLAGFFLVRGDRDAIAGIRASDEMHRLSQRAQQIVEGFGVVGVQLGGRIQGLMQNYLSYAQELG
jgi:hypothetical protein